MIYAHYSDFKGRWRWKNFTAKELSCKCCGEYYHDTQALYYLQDARDFAGRPFRINSGHRCVKYNKAVGGVPNSEHLKIAFDISTKGHDKEVLLQSLFDGGFTTFGLYESFIHTDTRDYKFWISGSKSLWDDVYNKVIKSHD